MAQKIKLKRSLVAGAVPVTDTDAVGVPYLNIPDNRMGFHDDAGVAKPLISITFHSDQAAYVVNDMVKQGGEIYNCVVAHTAEPFNLTNFKSIATVTGTGATFNYRWNNNKVGALSSGDIGVDTAFPLPVPPTQWIMYCHEETIQGANISFFWDAVRPGDFLVFSESTGNFEAAAMQVQVVNAKVGQVYSFSGIDVASSPTEPENNRAGVLSMVGNPAARLPIGGEIGDVMIKASTANYDVPFVDPPWMKWLGGWIAGAYEEHDVVLDNEWTMIANKDTSERAAPQLQEEAFILPTDIPWIQDTQSISYTGTQYELDATNLANISRYRVFLPFAAGNGNSYVMGLHDVTGARILIDDFVIPDGTPAGWFGRSIAPFLFGTGAVVNVVLRAAKVTAQGAADFTYRTNGAIPASGEVSSGFRSTQDFVYVSKTDDSSNAIDLSGSGVGTEIYIQEGTTTNRNEFWVTTGAVIDAGTYWNCPCELVEFDRDIRDNRAAIGVIEQPDGAPAEYNYNTDYWLDNQISIAEVKGIKGTTLEGMVEDDTAYGADIFAGLYLISLDWDVVALSSGGGGSGSSGGELPSGGAADDLLSKNSSDNFDTGWVNEIDSGTY